MNATPNSPKEEPIAFVGLGRMGANMARRMKSLGYRIAVIHDSDAVLASALAAELGTQAAKSLAEVSALASVVFTVVSDDAAMLAIFSSEGDSLLRNAGGRLFINCATISPQTHLEVASRARDVGAECLEACMASSITQAREGTLYLMTAGSDGALVRATPFLKDLSASSRHIGAAGTASQVKALVNMVMNINTAGLAEGLGLGAALGLDLAMLREVFSQTGADSRVLKTDGADMQNRDHECYFSAAHAAKDSSIALALAEQSGLHLPLAIAAKCQYVRMVESGLGELDKSGIAELTFPGRARPTGLEPT